MADKVQRREERVCEAIDRRTAELIETADWIHAHPETGHQEVEASKRLTGLLQAAGIPVEMGTAGMAPAVKGRVGGQPAAPPRAAVLGAYESLSVPGARG